jgi:hypothetical protein
MLGYVCPVSSPIGRIGGFDFLVNAIQPGFDAPLHMFQIILLIGKLLEQFGHQ